MKTKRFRRFSSKKIDEIIANYKKTISEEISSADQVLTWYVQNYNVTFRANQAFQIWKRIVRKTMGKSFNRCHEYPKKDKIAGGIILLNCK